MSRRRRPSEGPRLFGGTSTTTGSHSESKYGSLRFIAGALRTVALLLALLDLSATTWYLLNLPEGGIGEPSPGFVATVTVGAAFLGLLLALLIYAVGEAIECFVDIESNTRVVAEALIEENGE